MNIFGSRELVGLSLNNEMIRICISRTSGSTLKVVKLDLRTLVEPIEASAQTAGSMEQGLDAIGAQNSDADSIFGLDEEISTEISDNSTLEELEDGDDSSQEYSMDMVDESIEVQSNEILLYTVLKHIDPQKVNLGLNIPAGDVDFKIIRDADFNEAKKKDVVENLESRLESIYGHQVFPDHYAYEVREDGSLLLGSVEHEAKMVQLLNSTREFYSGKTRVQKVVADEMALAGLVRANYKLNNHEITAIIQFGPTKSSITFLKGNEIWLIPPIIDEGTQSKSILSTIFSKILFQLDTGEISDLDRVLLADNTIGNDALSYFRDNFPNAEVENVSYNPDIIDLNGTPRETVPGFTTTIATAYAASGLADEVMPKLRFLPQYVEDRQKIFKLQWHGIAILALIFLTPITFNYFYIQNSRQITSLSHDLNQTNSAITSIQPKVDKVNQLSEDLLTIKNKLSLLDSLVQGSKEWSVKLQQLNRGLQRVRSSWITSFSQDKKGSSIKGYSLYRNRIPQIVNIFDEATLLNVDTEKMHDKEVFSFDIYVQKFAPYDSVYSPEVPKNVRMLTAQNTN